MTATIFRLAKSNIRILQLVLKCSTIVRYSTGVQNLNRCLIQNNRLQKYATEMVDVVKVDYNFVRNIAKKPNTILIDVRNPEEIKETGLIPSSINIPVNELENALGPASSSDKFRAKYGIQKPDKNTEIVFTCRSGKRAKESAINARNMGFKNAKYYEGSWLEWERCTNK